MARAAVGPEIAWVVLNREVDYVRDPRKSSCVPIFGVTSDNLEIGRIQGRQIEAILPKGGTVLYLQGAVGDRCLQNAYGRYVRDQARKYSGQDRKDLGPKSLQIKLLLCGCGSALRTMST